MYRIFSPGARGSFPAYTEAEEGESHETGKLRRVIGVCALGLGLGILIAAIFPVGALMFLVAFLLIACGIICLKDGR